jgi:hypothetical protein
MRKHCFALGCLAIMGAMACSTTHVVAQWKNPTEQAFRPQKILVVAMVPTIATRIQLEQQLVMDLSRHGITAVPSSAILPPQERPQKDAIKQLVQQEHFDAVLVSHFKGVDQQMTYEPGWGYYGFIGWYAPYMDYPGYYQTLPEAKMETSLFDTNGNGKLVWTADTRTFSPDSFNKEIPSFASSIVKRLTKDVTS